MYSSSLIKFVNICLFLFSGRWGSGLMKGIHLGEGKLWYKTSTRESWMLEVERIVERLVWEKLHISETIAREVCICILEEGFWQRTTGGSVAGNVQVTCWWRVTCRGCAGKIQECNKSFCRHATLRGVCGKVWCLSRISTQSFIFHFLYWKHCCVSPYQGVHKNYYTLMILSWLQRVWKSRLRILRNGKKAWRLRDFR